MLKSELKQTVIAYLAGSNAQEVFYSLILDLSKHRAAIRGDSCQASAMPIHKSTGYNIFRSCTTRAFSAKSYTALNELVNGL